MASLNQSGNEHGAFTDADLERLYAALGAHQNRDRIVLVGGQSIVAWMAYYEIPDPTQGISPLTTDIDFIGNADDARQLAASLDAICIVPTLDDHTTNSAKVTWRSPFTNKLLTLDFMRDVIGGDIKKIRDEAAPMQFEKLHFFVQHPLHCLVSRFENLYVLRTKRTRNGITQAELAAQICAAYINELLDAGEQRLAIKQANFIARIARSKAGAFVYANYRIDPMQYIDPSRFTDFPKFIETDWPNQHKWAQPARAVAEKVAAAERLKSLRQAKP